MPPEQRALVRPALEPDADAEILLWQVTIDDQLETKGAVSIRDHFRRIKIFTQKGAQTYGRFDIDYPRKDVEVSDIAARTIRPDGTVIKVEKKAISDETIVKSKGRTLKRISVALPGVEPGSIVEYGYRMKHRDDSVWASVWLLQDDIPIHRVVYRLRSLPTSVVTMRQLTFHTRAEAASAPEPDGFYETEATQVPSYVEEPDMPPPAQELGFMALFYADPARTTPNTYWPEVGKKSAAAFDNIIKADDRMRQTATQITAGAASDRERVERIAAWVRKEFTIVQSWSSDSLRALGLREPADARQALAQGGGYPGDALSVFAGLLRACGVEARLTKVPSRSYLFFNRNMLASSYLEYDEVAVRLGGRWQTFDPTRPYLPWNMCSWDLEGNTALLCDRDSSQFIETGFSIADQSVMTRSVDLQLKPDGTLEGTARVAWSGHLNAGMRSKLSDATLSQEDSIATEVQGEGGAPIKFTSVALERGSDPTVPLVMTAHIVMPEFASVTGKRIVLEPAVFQARAKPRYSASTRRHPIYFRFPWTEVDTTRIRIPKGWKVETADKVEPLGAEGVSDYAATVTVSDDGTSVLYTRRFRMGIDGSIYFATKYYATVKELFDGIQKRDRVTVMLTKSETGP